MRAGEVTTAPMASRLVRSELPAGSVGGYVLLGLLGRGGMGDVYLAHDPALRRQVALKVLPAELAGEPELVARFHTEAAATASVRHPSVVGVYHHGQDGPLHYFAMQYVPGESLQHRLDRRGQLPLGEALALLRDCLGGLGAAHAAMLVHRDVKPGNILLDTRGSRPRALLADFGLVRRVEGTKHTVTGMVLGTVEYMAPEQGQGLPVDARADLYSLGVVAYQMLAGRLPLRGKSPAELLFKHSFEKPRPLAEAASEVPAEVAAVVDRLLAKNPDQRFPDCDSVLDALAGLCPQPESLAVPADSILAELPAPSAAPERLGATVLEADRVVAERENRAAELAALLAEADEVRAELAERAERCRADARRIAQLDGADPEAARCERLAAGLEAQASEQQQQLDELRQEHDRAAADAVCLRNRRDLLRARLVAARPHAPAARKAGRPKARSEMSRLRLAVGGGLLLLVTVGVLLVLARWLARPPARGPLDEKELLCMDGHAPEWVISVAISPDGKLALSGSFDHTLRLWDLETGKELHQLVGHTDQVLAVAFSPDGLRALSGSADSTMRLWDVKTGNPIGDPLHGHGNQVRCVQFLPDGRRAVSSSADSTIRLWDIDNRRELHQFKGHTSESMAVVLSRDGKRLLSACSDGTMRLWEVETGKELRCFKWDSKHVYATAFSPEGRRALSGGQDNIMRLWDLESGKELRRFIGHTDPVNRVAFAPGGRALSCGTDGTVRLWDLESGEELDQFKGHTACVFSLSLARDGGRVLTGGKDGTVRLWRVPEPPEGAVVAAILQDASLIMTFEKETFYEQLGKTYVRDLSGSGHDGLCDRVQFTHQGKAGGGLSNHGEGRLELPRSLVVNQPGFTIAGWVRLEDFSKEQCFYEAMKLPQMVPLFQIVFQRGRGIFSNAWNLDRRPDYWVGGGTRPVLNAGDWMFIAARLEGGGVGQGRYSVMVDGEEVESRLQMMKHPDTLNDLVFRLCKGTLDELAVWTRPLADEELSRIFERGRGGRVLAEGKVAERAPPRSARVPQVSPARNYRLASGSNEYRWVNRVCFAPDGKGVYFGLDRTRDREQGGGFQVGLLDLVSGTISCKIAHRGGIWGLDHTKESNLLLVGSYFQSGDKSYSVGLYDGTTARRRHLLRGHTDRVWGAAFSPDGKFAVTASLDRTARLWNVETGAEVLCIKSDWIFMAPSFSPDGKHLLAVGRDSTGGKDGAVCLWDLQTGKLVRELVKYQKDVGDPAFTPDGESVLVGGEVARLLDVKTGKEVRRFEKARGWGVTLSPDGRLFALTEAGVRKVRLWDFKSGRELAVFVGHTSHISGLSFSPDSRRIATSSFDGTVRLWDVPEVPK